MADAQYRVMARFLSQVFESTSETCAVVSQCVAKIHTATQKGSVTRAYDTLDVVTVMLYVTGALALATIAAMLYFYAEDCRNARIRRMPSGRYPYRTEATQPQTRNLKGNR